MRSSPDASLKDLFRDRPAQPGAIRWPMKSDWFSYYGEPNWYVRPPSSSILSPPHRSNISNCRRPVQHPHFRSDNQQFMKTGIDTLADDMSGLRLVYQHDLITSWPAFNDKTAIQYWRSSMSQTCVIGQSSGALFFNCLPAR